MKGFQLIILGMIFWWTKILALPYLFKVMPQNLIGEIYMETEQLLKKYNYPAETHFVTTEDGYILRLYRIPSPSSSKVVLLEHGLLDSSDTWIITGPWKALAYYYHDLGYDVWLGNARGNRYSRNHTTLDPNRDSLFWKFSWHEIGYYDIPAMIDYILENSKQENLTYVGHSQGTTAFFVMCSMRPEYNDKIKLMQALAPVAFMRNAKCLSEPTCKMGLAFLKFPGNQYIDEMFNYDPKMLSFCFSSKFMRDRCLDIIYQLSGNKSKQLNVTMLPLYLGHIPAGMALKQVRHYVQVFESDRFAQYDYGKLENLHRYGKSKPPEYSLSEVRAPVALYYSRNDNLVSMSDVKRLIENLPNVVENFVLADRNWSHIDYIWGIDARELLYKRMLEVEAQI